jgi:hypothetical protein
MTKQSKKATAMPLQCPAGKRAFFFLVARIKRHSGKRVILPWNALARNPLSWFVLSFSYY